MIPWTLSPVSGIPVQSHRQCHYATLRSPGQAYVDRDGTGWPSVWCHNGPSPRGRTRWSLKGASWCTRYEHSKRTAAKTIKPEPKYRIGGSWLDKDGEGSQYSRKVVYGTMTSGNGGKFDKLCKSPWLAGSWDNKLLIFRRFGGYSVIVGGGHEMIHVGG